MEAVLEMPGSRPQQKDAPSPKDFPKEDGAPRVDGRITRLISKFRNAKSPDTALQEIAQFDSSAKQIPETQNTHIQKGMRDRMLGILTLKNTSNPDAILSQIANDAEAVQNTEVEGDMVGEMVKNAKILNWCINTIKAAKDNPMGVAAFTVPLAIVAIEKMVGIPLPAEVVSVLPGGVGGVMSGVNMAPEKYGTKGKIVGAVVGAGVGMGISKGMEQVVPGPLKVAAGYVDDGASVIAKPVARIAKPVARIARKIIGIP